MIFGFALSTIAFISKKIVRRLYKKGYQTIFDFFEMINLTLMLINDFTILELNNIATRNILNKNVTIFYPPNDKI